jgi:hypothetical protein
MLDKVIPRFLDTWQEAAVLMTFRQTVADVMEFRVSEGESFELSVDEWRAFSKQASCYAARQVRVVDHPPGITRLWHERQRVRIAVSIYGSYVIWFRGTRHLPAKSQNRRYRMAFTPMPKSGMDVRPLRNVNW